MNTYTFEMIDTSKRNARPCGTLTCAQEGYVVDFYDQTSSTEVPALFVPFVEKGERHIEGKWVQRWVEDRVCPPSRQNIGEVLKAHGLNEYDVVELLRSGNGRSSQDSFLLYEVVKDGVGHYSEKIAARQALKNDIGKLIKSRRLELGLSQAEVSRNCGIDQARLSRIESGKSNISLELLADILFSLDLSLSVFLESTQPSGNL